MTDKRAAPADDPALRRALALHRFGLGGPDLTVASPDPRAWLNRQIAPLGPPTGVDARSGDESVALMRRLERERRERRKDQALREGEPAGAMGGGRNPAPAMAADDGVARARSGGAMAAADDTPRERVDADRAARLDAAAASARPFAERLSMFWANHFAVSNDKTASRGLTGVFEREVIRPHLAGRFEDMLQAAARHPAMLLYLDNHRSAGPNSRVVQQGRQRNNPDAPTGLNENLAREILELHTLGVSRVAGAGTGGGDTGGGYTQADVTAFAAVLTGWRADEGKGAPDQGEFEPAWHEPGAKTVLGRRYPEGPQALQMVLKDVAARPETARFLATKLVRHFVADVPPPALVERLSQAYLKRDGDLAAMYAALLDDPLAWGPQQAKLKTPEEFVISTARLLGAGLRAGGRPLERRADQSIARMGQVVQSPPSPAGWPDRAEEWLGPEAMWARMEWAVRIGERWGGEVDARALARRSLGPLLSDTTERQIERAADGPQALVLLLMAPEFQRR